MGLRFVRPEAVRLPLSDGAWIEVKEKLPFGEAERLRSMALRMRMSSADFSGGMRTDNVSLDMSAYKLARMQIYVTDWSARDELDKPVPLSHDALAALDEASAEEIDKALDGHIEGVRKAAEHPTNVIELVSLPS